jgi:type IV secretory pathway component VirB8
MKSWSDMLQNSVLNADRYVSQVSTPTSPASLKMCSQNPNQRSPMVLYKKEETVSLEIKRELSANYQIVAPEKPCERSS